MNKKRCALFTSVALATSLLLSGCQLMTGYNQIDKAEGAEAWTGKLNPIAGEVNISCIGTYHCEITHIDQALVIAPDTHKPVDSAMLSYISVTDDKAGNSIQDEAFSPLLNQKSVKVVPLSASGMPGLINYYVRVKPAKREVHVNFYPENNVGYIEHFAMIHEFLEAGNYKLRAYRKQSTQTQDGVSLLETASPNPLCVELTQDNIVKRRFCKQTDAESQGEFVESTITDKIIKSEAKASNTKAQV